MPGTIERPGNRRLDGAHSARLSGFMRGRRRTVAAVLAEALAGRRGGHEAALAATFCEACGPRLARQLTFKGVLKDGRLLVVASSEGWATQLLALERVICDRVDARMGAGTAPGIEVRT